MAGKSLIPLMLVVILAAGCRRGAAKVEPEDQRPATQIVRGAFPIINRTINQHDLGQLRIFIEQARAERGQYPRTLDDLPGLNRDAPNLYQALRDGELVLAGGQGGVLAYEKAALAERGSVVTEQGVMVLTAEELRQRLGPVGR